MKTLQIWYYKSMMENSQLLLFALFGIVMVLSEIAAVALAAAFVNKMVRRQKKYREHNEEIHLASATPVGSSF